MSRCCGLQSAEHYTEECGCYEVGRGVSYSRLPAANAVTLTDPGNSILIKWIWPSAGGQRAGA
jgi:hypothetical protein